MEEGELLNQTVVRIGPEGLNEVMQNVCLKQREAVCRNRPFRFQFHPHRGFVTFRNDKHWFLAKIEGQIPSNNQKWGQFYEFSLLKIFETDGSSSRAIVDLRGDAA